MLALILSLALYGETLREYKEEVMHDMNGFYQEIKQFDRDDSMGKTIVKQMEFMVVARNYQQADLITLIYLDFKVKVASTIMSEIEKIQERAKKENYEKK